MLMFVIVHKLTYKDKENKKQQINIDKEVFNNL